MSVLAEVDTIFCFRADASHVIGTGHIMRCLTLARALRERGGTCIFVCRDHLGNLGGLIAQEGFEVRLLVAPEQLPEQLVPDEDAPAHAGWVGANWEQDALETIAAIGDRKIDWLVVDHYGLDRRWEEALRTRCRRIFVIDDLADREHDCDLLLDQNLVAGMGSRYDGLVPPRCGLLLGPHYALLRPEYGELHDRVPPREGPVRRILVYFGGADTHDLTGRTIDALTAIDAPELTIDVILNPSGEHTDAIRRTAGSDSRVILHERIQSLASLMVQADLAIGAAGTTTWERLCLGLPAFVVTLADNQVPIAEELDRRGLIRWLGDARDISADYLWPVLAEALTAPLSEAWSRACADTLDGRGLSRVAQLLLLGPASLLRARPARLADEALLLEWANDPETRQNAFSSDAIDTVSHRNWFRARLRHLDTVRIFVIETLEGLSVGQVRFELIDFAWEIDYSIDRLLRGRKMGRPLLEGAIEALREEFDSPISLSAKVKHRNVASLKLFEALGFKPSENCGNFRRFFHVID